MRPVRALVRVRVVSSFFFEGGRWGRGVQVGEEEGVVTHHNPCKGKITSLEIAAGGQGTARVSKVEKCRAVGRWLGCELCVTLV